MAPSTKRSRFPGRTNGSLTHTSSPSITLKFVNFTIKTSEPTEEKENKGGNQLPSQRPYVYKPLTTPNEIRLVKILPGREDAPVCCKIVHSDVQNSILKYSALSYTWGDARESFRVAYESPSSGIYLTVTRNCYLAIKRLRNMTESRLIWIDAICIDQASITERNHQVGIMDRIYAKASQTIVYLGEEENNSEHGMELVRLLSSKDYGYSHRELLLSANKDSIGKLLDRPWCNRIWVLQEVFVSQSLTVLCGPSKVPWAAMANLFRIIKEYPQDFDWPYIPCVLSLTENYMKERLTLWDLLCQTRQCASTDPRDKLFALSAMISDKDRYQLVPDYGMDERDVFINLALQLFDTGGLDFLLAAQYFPSNLDLPSWVPDWSLRFGMEYINEVKPLERAGGMSSRAMATVVDLQSLYNYKVPNPKRQILKVRGISLGEIKTVSNVEELHGPGWRERLEGMSFMPKLHNLKTVSKNERQEPPERAKPLCTCCPLLQKGSGPDVNWRTITAGRAGQKVEGQGQISSNYPLIMKTMHGCKRFVTKCGYLGRTPTDARKDDIICVFLGAVAPCILRQHGKFWILVGGYSYLDGAMEGETVEYLVEKDCSAPIPAAPLRDFLLW